MSDWYRFQLVVHAAPAAVARAEQARRIDATFNECGDGGEVELTPLAVTAAQLDRPLDSSFEAVGDRLSELPRVYFEPDGSFVGAGEQDGRRWQVDGVVYDRAGRVQYVELKGHSPREIFDRFLSALGWPATPLVFQLPRASLYLDEPEARRVMRCRS